MVLNQSPARFATDAQVSIQLEEQGCATVFVKRRSRDSDGNVSGRYNENPFLNSLGYEAKFPDGYVKEYSANIIAENMLTQVDSYGYSLTMINAIIDYERDDSVYFPKSDG